MTSDADSKPTLDLVEAVAHLNRAAGIVVERDMRAGFVTEDQIAYTYTALARSKAKEAAHKLAEKGMSQRAIADLTGASKSTVARWLNPSAAPNGAESAPNGAAESSETAANEPSPEDDAEERDAGGVADDDDGNEDANESGGENEDAGQSDEPTAQDEKIAKQADRSLFLLNADSAVGVAKFDGPVDRQILSACRAVIKAWSKLLTKLEAEDAQTR